jgi:hypothetical protein
MPRPIKRRVTSLEASLFTDPFTFQGASTFTNDLILNGGLTTNKVATVTVPSAQVLALFATPRTIIAAPGANLAIVPHLVAIRHAGGTAYAGVAAGEDLVLKYTDASGGTCSDNIETTGFIDQTGAQIRVASVPTNITPVANAAVVLHLLSGEVTTGNFDLIVRVWYEIIPTNFTV